MTKRVTIKLSSREQSEFARLPGFPGEAFRFWRQAAETRGLDGASVYCLLEEVTALPKGHGQYWCYPLPLPCKRPPPAIVEPDFRRG